MSPPPVTPIGKLGHILSARDAAGRPPAAARCFAAKDTAMLDREELIEQAHFFKTLIERLGLRR